MARGRRNRLVGVDLGVFGDVGVDGDYDPPAGEAAERGDDQAPDEAIPRARVPRARAAVAVGVVVLLGLSAWGATTDIAARQERATLMTAPGGVLSLARPLSAAWTAAADTDHLPAFMPGLVVVQRGAELHALDAGTGTERWQVEVGDTATCGPALQGWQSLPEVDPLVCVDARPDGRQIVTVIRTNGTSVTRTLEPDVTTAAPTASGDLVTVRRTGPTPPSPDVRVIGQLNADGTTGPDGYLHVEGSVAAGQDAVVGLEDAATGTPRWARTVAFTPVADASTCGAITVADNQATFDATHVTLTTPSSLVIVQGCGIQGAFTAAGAPVDHASPQGAATWWQPYADGGVLRSDATPAGQAQTLVRPDGTTTQFADHDQVLSPLATDGTHPDAVLLSTPDQSSEARRRDGSALWHSTLPVSQLLARTSRAAVVMYGYDAAGIDLTTGKTLWVDPGSFLESTSTTRDRAPDATDLGTGDGLSASGAFTDGERVTLALDNPDGTAHGLVTLDPSTGDVRWRTPAAGSTGVWSRYFTVAGHLVQLSVPATPSGPDATSATITAWH